jgi:hypothetical protein
LIIVEPRKGRKTLFSNAFCRPFGACVVKGLDFLWV